MKINRLPQTQEMTLEQRKLWDACLQLEQSFLEIMMKQMQAGSGGGLFPKTFQRDVYEDMQRQSLAEQMAKSGGIGLATMLYQQQAKLLEAKTE